MTALQSVISLDALVAATALLVVAAFAVRAVRRRPWRDEDREPVDRTRPESTHGYPMASWRYVYDVDKSAAKREVASVEEQAETLARADEKRR